MQIYIPVWFTLAWINAALANADRKDYLKSLPKEGIFCLDWKRKRAQVDDLH